MALLPNAVDVQNTKEMTSFEPLPAATYVAHVMESEVKPTQKGGQMLVLKFQVLDGQYAQRNFWVRLNIENSNKDAEAMALQELASISRAANIMTRLADSNQLHNVPMRVTLKITPAKGNFGPGNQPTKYEAIAQQGQAAPQMQQQQTQQQQQPMQQPQQQQQPSDAPPWQQ